MQRRSNQVEFPTLPPLDRLSGVSLMVARGNLRTSALDFRSSVFDKEQGTEGLDEFDQHAAQLVACEEGQIVAAARFVDPEQRPFGLERYFDLCAHVGQRERIGELSRYCLREDWREITRGTFLHLGMLKLALEYSRSHRVTSIVGSVQPRFRPLYRRVHFRPIGQTFQHPVFGDTTIMLLDLANMWSDKLGRHPLRALLDDPRVPGVTL